MKKFLILLLLAGIAYACGGGETADNDTPDSTTPPVAKAEPAKTVDGQKVYKTYCITCHGLYGDMGASGAFNLQTSELAVAERMTVITNGRGAMTPFKEILDEDEIKAVAEYTLTLSE
jgi:mono/diheme cytochrome c family protein